MGSHSKQLPTHAMLSSYVNPQSTIRAASIIAPVLSLFLTSGPLAVALAVATIVVFALKCKPFRSITHVLQKVLECKPALTDCNASAAVAMVVPVARIEASAEHITPASVTSRANLTYAHVRTRRVDLIVSLEYYEIPLSATGQILMDVEYYTAKEAAERLGLNYPTFLARVRKGRYECRRIGWALLFPKDEINRAADHDLSSDSLVQSTR